jgi:hypothetical protein
LTFGTGQVFDLYKMHIVVTKILAQNIDDSDDDDDARA